MIGEDELPDLRLIEIVKLPHLGMINVQFIAVWIFFCENRITYLSPSQLHSLVVWYLLSHSYLRGAVCFL